jgi:hypothetical protein
MPTTKPHLAFMAAAMVLLVMPLLVMAGLMAIGLATGAGMMSQMERMMGGDISGVVLGFFVVWVVLVVTAVLAVIALLIRRSART